MKFHYRHLALRALLVAATFLTLLPCVVAQEAGGTIVLEGALLIDGTGRPPLPDSALVIQDGRIRAIGKTGPLRYPEGARVVKVRGKTIMPSLINLHGHLGLTRGLEQSAENYTKENILKQLKQYLAYGVGTVVSLGSDQDLIYRLRDLQRDRDWPGSHFYTAGRGFGVEGGYPPPLANAADRYRPHSAEEARAQVEELASHYPDFIKIWVDDDFGRLPKMPMEISAAIIDEAHRHHLRVVAHVFCLADAKALVEAGVDGLGHSIRDQKVDLEIEREMKSRGVFLIPTLVRDESAFVYGETPGWLDDPFFQAGVSPEVLKALKSPAFVNKSRANPDLEKLKAAFEMAKSNLRLLSEAGVRIGFGTDSGPPARFQGYFEHRELQLMVEAGLTPMRAIVAATRTAAEILGADSGFGTLAPGKRADFLVLDANPLEDIHNTEKLVEVWQSGRPIPAIGGD
jgi:imidazolonepropionase-like amidohydrolase